MSKKTAVHCRYHVEITPSCLLDHDKGTFHCLGCGAEGTFTGYNDKGGPLFTRYVEKEQYSELP